MAAPRLNVDVLAIVSEFLPDVSDVLSLGLTCSSIHLISIARILSMRAVCLTSGSLIRRFHSFLFDNAHARARHIRAIDINLRWHEPGVDDCSFLVNILSSCTRLECLTLAIETASFKIIADPRFLPTIAAIPNLHSISLHSTSIDILSILPHIRTPLRMLKLRCANADPNSRFPAVLEQSLPRIIARSLETLALDKFTVDLFGYIQTPINLPMPSFLNMRPYPAVRSLSVSSLQGWPLLGHLQHLFPALDGTLDLSTLDMRVREEACVPIRTVNHRTQDGHGLDGSSGKWKKLDRIICGASMLYVLGLRCPIRLAMIEFDPVDKHGYYIADALRENPVPRLKLTVDHDLGAFNRLFSPNLAETLTHLTLCLLYSNDYSGSGSGSPDEKMFKWDSVLDTIVSALRPLRKLTHLRVVIGVSVYVHIDASWPFAPWEEYAHTFRPSRFDFEGTAATLSRALPSLQYVFLATGGFLSNWGGFHEPACTEEPESRWKPYERWYVCHGWRVAKPGTSDGDEVPEGEQSLVELHDDVAETIIRKEELILSKRDKGALHLNYGWGCTTPPLSAEDVRKRTRNGTYM